MLRVSALHKSFGAIRALDGVDLVVEAGRIHGIIGPNGSGKTTLFNCVSGLLRADAGSIIFERREITRDRPDVIARGGLRRTFQAGKIIPSLTVLENVMCGVNDKVGAAAWDVLRPPFVRSRREGEIREGALATLDIVGMTGAATRMATDLVWAERQLVQIARALVARPRLLLLDEPATGMGPQEIEGVEQVIRRIRDAGTTVVVVSHDVRMLMKLSEIVTVLSFGQKIAEGPPDAIRADPKVQEAYLGAD
jgi:ABC-type branched-subunit amino acid transport system ATPase component